MADNSESISYVGECLLEKAELIGHDNKVVDITALLVDLTIYEDLFSPTMSGYALIGDAVDLITSLPMIGQEKISISLRTPTIKSSITKTFYVYKLQNRTSDFAKRSQAYMLCFCSMELIYSQNVRISKAYKGNITDTVESIFRDQRYLASSSKLMLDRTQNEYSFVATYWSPIETINWLTTKSLNKNGVANYLFFETNQSFEYSSVDTLIQAAPTREYVFADIDNTTAIGTGVTDEKYSYVQSIDTNTTFDYLRNLSGGMLASKLTTFDLTTKNINISTFDYIDDFDKAHHAEKYPMRTDTLARRKLANQYFIEKNNYQTGTFHQQGYNKFFLQRNSLLEQLNAFKINIKVHGRTDMKVGQTVKFTMPQFKQLTAGEVIGGEIVSDYYSGKYLITAIRHQFIKGGHTQHMEIVSDSFIKPLIGTK